MSTIRLAITVLTRCLVNQSQEVRNYIEPSQIDIYRRKLALLYENSSELLSLLHVQCMLKTQSEIQQITDELTIEQLTKNLRKLHLMMFSVSLYDYFVSAQAA